MIASPTRDPAPGLLATCDVAVCGGGIAGTAAALELAAAGHDVVLLEQRSALMWELTRARQQASAESVGALSPLLADLVRALRVKHGLKGDTFHPVLLQLVLDVFAQQAGLRTIFQVSPLQIHPVHEQSGLTVATRAGLRTIAAGAVLDATDRGVLFEQPQREAGPGVVLWHLVLATGAPVEAQTVALEVGERVITARIRPDPFAPLVGVDLALQVPDTSPSAVEVQLAQLIDPAVRALRTQLAALQEAPLVVIAEEPYLLAQLSHASVPGGAAPNPAASELIVEDDDGRLHGVGLWVPALRTLDLGLPAWEQSRVLNTRLFQGGVALAHAFRGSSAAHRR